MFFWGGVFWADLVAASCRSALGFPLEQRGNPTNNSTTSSARKVAAEGRKFDDSSEQSQHINLSFFVFFCLCYLGGGCLFRPTDRVRERIDVVVRLHAGTHSFIHANACKIALKRNNDITFSSYIRLTAATSPLRAAKLLMWPMVKMG